MPEGPALKTTVMNGRITKTVIYLFLMIGHTHVIHQFKGLNFLYLMI